MERVTAFANDYQYGISKLFVVCGSQHDIHTKSTVITRIFAGRASSVELDSTNATYFVLWHIPPPRRYSIPFLYDDFHIGKQVQARFGQGP